MRSDLLGFNHHHYWRAGGVRVKHDQTATSVIVDCACCDTSGLVIISSVEYTCPVCAGLGLVDAGNNMTWDEFVRQVGWGNTWQ